jgi:hypothetical protein
MAIRISTSKDWLRIVCAVLLLSLGFAHRPVVSLGAPDVKQAAFALPNGQFADLCITAPGETQPAKAVWHGCDACRIAGGALLPPPPSALAIGALVAAECMFPPGTARHISDIRRPGSPVRGPPTLSV